MFDPARMVHYLRGWIGFVGLMALGNTIQCFRNHMFLKERLYNGKPHEVSGLAARLFGTWTLLAAILRIACSIDIKNKFIYNLTFASFLLALFHFLAELFIFQTAKLDVGVAAPLIVSGISSVLMLAGYWIVDRSNNNMDIKEDMFNKAKKKKT